MGERCPRLRLEMRSLLVGQTKHITKRWRSPERPTAEGELLCQNPRKKLPLLPLGVWMAALREPDLSVTRHGLAAGEALSRTAA